MMMELMILREIISKVFIGVKAGYSLIPNVRFRPHVYYAGAMEMSFYINYQPK